MFDVSNTADAVVVGGSAGAVLAARLSQDPARTVLLLEAGHAYAPDAYTSTVLMGGSGDPWAITDSVGVVKGVNGLRVVDASIMPDIPSTAINLTVIMLAERIYQRVYAG